MGLVLPVSNVARADFTAQLLRELCESRESPAKFACVSFFYAYRVGKQQGTMEILTNTKKVNLASNATVEQAEQMGKEAEKLYAFTCIPDKVTNPQLAEVFLKYMKEHPERLHEEVSFVMNDMLYQHYPCRKLR